jgi:hypothetical protein
MKKCYSRNEEDFCFNSVDEAVSELLDDNYLRTGETATLWEGDAIQNRASHYLGCIAEDMQDRACDECGEYADGWDFSKAQRESLQEVVSNAVDQWAAENNMQPHFYTVENVVKFTVRFTDDNGGFEILPGENDQVEQPPGGRRSDEPQP